MSKQYRKEGELNPFNSARTQRYEGEGIAITLRVGETNLKSDSFEAVLTVEEALLFASRLINDCRMFCTSDDPNNHQGDTCPVHEQ